MKCVFLPVPGRLFPIRMAQASLAHATTTTGLVGSGGVAGADGSTAGRAQLCREWRAVLMMARERAHAESAESQAHGRDARRITKYGDLVKY